MAYPRWRLFVSHDVISTSSDVIISCFMRFGRPCTIYPPSFVVVALIILEKQSPLVGKDQKKPGLNRVNPELRCMFIGTSSIHKLRQHSIELQTAGIDIIYFNVFFFKHTKRQLPLKSSYDIKFTYKNTA